MQTGNLCIALLTVNHPERLKGKTNDAGATLLACKKEEHMWSHAATLPMCLFHQDKATGSFDNMLQDRL
jgi:hypothetical protein